MNFVARIVSMLAIIVSAAAYSAGQQRLPLTADPVQRISADETFDLKIVERRITENEFFAATAVGFESRPGQNISMNVGVEVRAGKIDVLLRNVTGTVRFRGSVQKVLDLINSRPARSPR